ALLCDLLDRAILLSNRRGAERRPYDDSQIWRPAVEEHEQNSVPGLNSFLVTAVRKAVERIARKSPDSVPDAVRRLDQLGESWVIFRRIALHLLRLFPDSAPDLVRERLLNRKLFDDTAIRHEYFLLQQGCFGRLVVNDQSIVLNWIEVGPPEELTKLLENFFGRNVSDEE